jgi:tRNA(fMet)-specific endonuclease VapC
MILLDSDHLTVFSYRDHPRAEALNNRLQAAREPVGLTVISVEEQMRGWLAEIKKHHAVSQQISANDRLIKMVQFFQEWTIIRLDEAASEEYTLLKKSKVRIGTQDLKIAAITLTQHALLLSANLRDFQKVPGLRVENWLSS